MYHQVQTADTESPCKCISPTKSARAVSFSPDVFVKRTIHINNYSDDEFEATWYNDADYQHMREEINLTVEMMETCNGPIDNDKYCTRGLEFRTTKGAIKRIQNRNNAIDAVLDEQDLQWHKGVNKPTLISKAYQTISYQSSIAAQIAGVVDANMSRDVIARTGTRTNRQFNNSTICRSLRQCRV